jgi:hypothetical protein
MPKIAPCGALGDMKRILHAGSSVCGRHAAPDRRSRAQSERRRCGLTTPVAFGTFAVLHTTMNNLHTTMNKMHLAMICKALA